VEGLLLTFLGEVQIDHGGLQCGVAHVFLDDAQVDACLQEMGCVGVAIMPSPELCRVMTGFY
jgi:hypothetical protein